jgi:ABC-type hemin transport system substrate-binding protein
MTVVVSNPEQQKQIKSALEDISDALTIIASAQATIKDIKADLAETFKETLTKKQINKMAKVYYKKNYKQEVQEAEDFQYLYESVTGVKIDD